MMKKTILWFLVLISLMVLVIRFGPKLGEMFLGIKEKSGINVLSNPDGAKVFLDGTEEGNTPYENKELEVREYQVKMDKDGAIWEGKVNLVAGTLTVVNRDLSKDSTSSAGEVLTLKKGKGITIISSPTDASVEIDDKEMGKTPLSLDLSAGEHSIGISHSGYLKRSLRASLPSNYNLAVSVDLALSEADLTAVSTPAITTTPEVVVKSTPTGFLRVRDKPSLAGKEITQVKVGDILILLEELTGWDRVRLSDNTEGYVSATYVSKKP